MLGDEERARVGTIYVQTSRFEARRLGAALVARNIAAHLEGALADRDGRYAPLIYCWRGGQRSAAMATVFDQVGWRPTLLAGGYRTYRRGVTVALYEAEPRLKVVLLGGPTGSAKTAILGRLAALGVQTIDLEGLAGHRGSLLGDLAGEPQPSQKMFESRLAAVLAAMDPARAVVVEAESSKIGQRMVPPVLWKAMVRAPVIELLIPAPVRARYLLEAYGDLTARPDALCAALARLPVRLGRARLAAWIELARRRDFEALAAALIEAHYDPAYARWGRTHGGTPRASLALAALGPADQAEAAQAIRDLIGSMETS